MYVCVCVCVCVTMMGYRDAGGSPRLGAPGPGLDHQDNHSGHAKKEVGVPVGKGLAMASGNVLRRRSTLNIAVLIYA